MTRAISRRNLIGAGAAIAAALTTPEWALASTEENGSTPIQLGVASYSFHKFDRAHAIKFMKELQCSRLNAKDVNDHLPMTPASATDEAIAAYKAAGIELTAGGVIYFPVPDKADIERKFAYAKRAGLPMIVGSPARDVLPLMDEFVKRYDIRLAIHNHGPEDRDWPSPMDVLKVIGPMDRRIGLCIDVGHTTRAGTDPVLAIQAGGARVLNVHMKDLADLRVKESQVAVGDGKMPVRRIFLALHLIGYKGFVDLEYEIHEDDPLPGMMKSFAYMRGVLSGMGLSG